MDRKEIVLARTFLEIIASGNLVTAAMRWHVTQSAVPRRFRKPEQSPPAYKGPAA